jgi:hypothetical protein
MTGAVLSPDQSVRCAVEFFLYMRTRDSHEFDLTHTIAAFEYQQRCHPGNRKSTK